MKGVFDPNKDRRRRDGRKKRWIIYQKKYAQELKRKRNLLKRKNTYFRTHGFNMTNFNLSVGKQNRLAIIKFLKNAL